jgi:hypothetical protein
MHDIGSHGLFAAIERRRRWGVNVLGPHVGLAARRPSTAHP